MIGVCNASLLHFSGPSDAHCASGRWYHGRLAEGGLLKKAASVIRIGRLPVDAPSAFPYHLGCGSEVARCICAPAVAGTPVNLSAGPWVNPAALQRKERFDPVDNKRRNTP